MENLILDREACTVAFARDGISVDLGAIAKGYALDQAGEILRECGVGGALLHGGTSSVTAVGPSPAGEPWRVEVRDPDQSEHTPNVVELTDRALGVSGVHGRTTGGEDGTYGHVMDPRSGRPASCLRMAAVAGPTATDADALATALLVLGPPFEPDLRRMGYECWSAGPAMSEPPHQRTGRDRSGSCASP
jgi:thiamine biosynthesis lipoprotein